MKYSVIIPVDLKLRPFDILKKIKNILKRASNEVEIVFGHNDRGSIFDKYLRKITADKNNVKLVSDQFYTKLICQSLLRNKAVEQCSCEYIYLMDVDLYFDESIINSCFNDIKINNQPFAIMPCIYLTRKGSRAIFKFGSQVMFEKYIAFNPDLFLHLASPSSSIIMKKQDYYNIGGFDEDFLGRGGEDFEFMLKLALFHNAIEPTSDLMVNKFYKSPLLSEGFRKYLSFLCLPFFFKKNVVFHLYHRRNKSQEYFKQYDKNLHLLNDKIKFNISNKKGSSLIVFYEKLCQEYNVNIDKYAILFNNYQPKISSLEHILLFLKRL